MISRKELLSIVGMNTDMHTSLKRRDLIPIENVEDRHYRLIEAFAFLIYEQLVETFSMSRIKSRDIVRGMITRMIERGEDIEASLGATRDAAIFGGAVYDGRWRPFVGTRAGFAQEFPRADNALAVVLIDLSTLRHVMETRARRIGVTTETLWTEAGEFPTAEELEAQVTTIWDQAIAAANARNRSPEE